MALDWPLELAQDDPREAPTRILGGPRLDTPPRIREKTPGEGKQVDFFWWKRKNKARNLGPLLSLPAFGRPAQRDPHSGPSSSGGLQQPDRLVFLFLFLCILGEGSQNWLHFHNFNSNTCLAPLHPFMALRFSCCVNVLTFIFQCFFVSSLLPHNTQHVCFLSPSPFYFAFVQMITAIVACFWMYASWSPNIDSSGKQRNHQWQRDRRL